MKKAGESCQDVCVRFSVGSHSVESDPDKIVNKDDKGSLGHGEH